MSELDEITDFLCALAGAGAQVIDTHISRVVIGAERAYKIKRPVLFPYLDFSTREKRAAAAANELALNRRTAPELYLGLRRVTREACGGLALDGAGEAIETVVEMRSFDQDDLFDALAQQGRLTSELMTKLTQRIAQFHAAAAPDFSCGGAEGVARVLRVDEPALASSGLATPERIAALGAALEGELARLAPLLDARRAAGKVRRCHGDLTLRNICLFRGEPTPFDCIEFDDALGVIDVLYDLAFLLMDLTHRGRPDLANLVFNRYLDQTEEEDGVAALPLFMAVRATIRAHVTAAQAKGADAARASALTAEGNAYFDLAERLLAPRPAMLVAIGGYSGSGKSTLAAALAPALGAAPGARVLSSDRIRKKLHGVPPTDRLPQAAYAPEASERVYAEMRGEAARLLRTGASVVADAVFDRATLRAEIENVAAQAGVAFRGVWLEGRRADLSRRIEARRGDPSDATVAVMEMQMARGEPPADWLRLDAAAPTAALREAVRKVLSD